MQNTREIVLLLLGYFVLAQCQSFIKDVTITQGEKDSLEKFRTIMAPALAEDYMRTDIYLIRWLRAAFFNVKEAERLLKENLEWRRKNRMETIHQEDWSDLYRDYKYSVKGRDREGKPQLFVNLADWDLRRAALSGKSPRFQRYIDKIFDETIVLVRELGDKYENVSQAVLLINVDGFNLIQHGCLNCISLMLNLIRTYESRFPGYADKLIFVNTPAIADPVSRATRPAYHPITQKALIIYGKSRRNWWPKLLKDFEEDQIPTQLGGLLDTGEFD